MKKKNLTSKQSSSKKANPVKIGSINFTRLTQLDETELTQINGGKGTEIL